MVEFVLIFNIFIIMFGENWGKENILEEKCPHAPYGTATEGRESPLKYPSVSNASMTSK